jgi:predicted metalloprotease
MKWLGYEESGNVEDRRRLVKKGVAVGGIGALLLAVVGYFLGLDPNKLNQLVRNAQGGGDGGGVVEEGGGDGGGVVKEGAPTAEEEHSRKFVATVLRFTEDVWEDQFRRVGKRYEAPHLVLFSDQVQTGCGAAPAAVGPFYCPADRTVYLDPTFFDELERKLGGSKAEFSQAYVIAHEVGHHVQNLLGYSSVVEQKRRTLPKEEYNQWSVRLELQADYLAGVWAHHGQEKFNFIEAGDVESAIKSANAIGDDRLQKRARGFTSPENYTHGTSAQRVKWFRLGLETGDLSMLPKIFEMPYREL